MASRKRNSKRSEEKINEEEVIINNEVTKEEVEVKEEKKYSLDILSSYIKEASFSVHNKFDLLNKAGLEQTEETLEALNKLEEDGLIRTGQEGRVIEILK